MVYCLHCGRQNIVFFGDDHVCLSCFMTANDNEDEKDKAMYYSIKIRGFDV